MGVPSERLECLIHLVLFWMITMEAEIRMWILDEARKRGETFKREFMVDRSLEDCRCLPFPRPPSVFARALPALALRWATEPEVRRVLHKAGYAAGALAVYAPRARPAFLGLAVCEIYCVFALFRPHMHFTPLYYLVFSWAVDRRAPYRGAFLVAVVAQSYAASGAWRAANFLATEGFLGGLEATTYGRALRHFLRVFQRGCPFKGGNRRLLALTDAALGSFYMAATLGVEAGLLPAVAVAEAAAVALPLGDAALGRQAAFRAVAAAAVVAFHAANFLLLGIWFGTQAATVACVLLLYGAAPQDPQDPQDPGPPAAVARGALMAGVLAGLFYCAARRVDRFPQNAIILFPYPAGQARLLACDWAYRDGTLRVLMLPRPLATLGGAAFAMSLKELSAANYLRTVVGASNPNMPACVLPEEDATVAFTRDLYAAAGKRGLLEVDDADETGWGRRFRRGYPGVAELVLADLAGRFAEMKAAFEAARPFYDPVSETDDLVLVLAAVSAPDAEGRSRVRALVPSR